MGHNHDHDHDETPEALAKREAQKRAAEKQSLEVHQPGEGGFFAAIVGFLKWFFGLFTSSKDAPDEQAPSQTPRETPSYRERIGNLLVESRAIPKWHEYMREHKGEKVEFKNPMMGSAVVGSNYGMRLHPINKVMKMHHGVDLIGGPGIAASASGIVLFSGEKEGYGKTVIIGHADGHYTLYAHMNGQHMPAVGSRVAQGAQIGVMGATGKVDGAHLHYEQRYGENSVQPRINGIAITKGMTIAAVTASPETKMAALANREQLPKLAVQDGGKPRPLAMVASSTGMGSSTILR